METKIIVWLVKTLYQLVVFILKLIGKGLNKLLELDRARRARSRTSPTAETPATMASASPSTPRPAAPANDPLRKRLADELPKLTRLADGLVARCRREPACALLLPTFDDFVVPGLAKIASDAPRAGDRAAVIALLVEAARIANLLGLLELLVQQRGDGDLVELIDDADALAAACYLPVADFCQERGLPLSSDRVATLFGGDCSPALARVDDPSGMAILQLPWSWLAEVHRWPAVAHEVGHDFYMSVTGLDDQLLARVGLTAVRDGGPMPTGANGFHRGHVDTIIAAWRHELVADAFGVMMLGPAYAITTLEIFANPGDRDRTLVIDRDGDGYEAHPPAHVRAIFVCRLLQRMGYGKVGDVLEQQWRALHGNPDRLYLPVAKGWLHLLGDMLIEPALAVGVALYEEGFAALE
ncbi:MAG TPA: hypothetical protein VHB97_10295, partial [Polyangia bacterium]|nr:hypothetical protein [Polyangia bacterium]